LSGDSAGAARRSQNRRRCRRAPRLGKGRARLRAAEAWEQAASAAGERAALAGRPAEQAKLYAIEAGYLTRAGDEAAAIERLEQATELDPPDDALAQDLEKRLDDGRAAPRSRRVSFASRPGAATRQAPLVSSQPAADMQRDRLGDGDAARETLLALLEDGDDVDALVWLADDAEKRGDASAAPISSDAFPKAATDPEQRPFVLLREAGLYAGALSDPEAAIARYERVLDDLDPNHDEALAKIAELYEGTDQPGPAAAALERRLKANADNTVKLEVANKLADLYEGPLDDPKSAVRALDVIRGLDPEDFSAVQRLAELCEKLEDWPRVADHLAELMEVEGDEEEVSRMTRRRAEILHQKVGKGDEALAALLEVADRGDVPCRDEYVALGDELGWKGVVAVKLVEWNIATPASPKRTEALRGAFDRFLQVERKADAAAVGREVARAKGTDAEFAERLEKLAVELKDLDTLAVAHDLLVQDRTGPGRAAEFVRQAEVLLESGVEPAQAVQHGEQALTSVAPNEVEPLLERLAKLTTDSALIIEIYERQVTRCKNPADKLAALARAARVAAAQNDYERARGFFDLVLGAGAPEEAIELLENAARTSDVERATDKLRRVLAEALAAGGQGARDGGRTRSAMLGRAARIAFEDLGDREQAFVWIGDAVVAHVGDERLEQLEVFAAQVGDLKRAETVIGRALEEVFDGPLVRKLLARRAGIRREQLGDRPGAAADLRRLHDLSPCDAAVVDQLLLTLYTELQTAVAWCSSTRTKSSAARIRAARRARAQGRALWEEKLDDPREAADAWRRVLAHEARRPRSDSRVSSARSPACSSVRKKTLVRRSFAERWRARRPHRLAESELPGSQRFRRAGGASAALARNRQGELESPSPSRRKPAARRKESAIEGARSRYRRSRRQRG
jgi:tetratricopeptide (TPR) repeat protein